jgi:hypothetical protein
MQVCREWFALWVDDRMWIVHEERIFSRHPELRDLLHRATEATKKRHRRFLIVPHKGTWWFFKKRLSLGFTMKGFGKLCDDPELHPLAIAVAKSMLPSHSNEYVKEIVHSFIGHHSGQLVHGVFLVFANGKTMRLAYTPDREMYPYYEAWDGRKTHTPSGSTFYNHQSLRAWSNLVKGETYLVVKQYDLQVFLSSKKGLPFF